MWSKHDLLRFAGAEITGEDTMKRCGLSMIY